MNAFTKATHSIFTFLKLTCSLYARSGQPARARGFTLIELMVVLAIIGLFLTIAAPRFMSGSSKVRGEVRRLAVMGKALRSKARIHNLTYRIVIYMPTDEDENKTPRYWVEKSSQQYLLPSAEELEDQRDEIIRVAENKADGEANEGDISDDDEDKPPPSPFAIDPLFGAEPKPLPKGFKFLSVELTGRDEPITQGAAYIHFFPSGLTEEAAIHVGDGEKLHWTVALSPLTGQGEIITKDIPLKEIRPQ